MQVPGVMRSQGVSLKEASKQFGLRPEVVRRLARTAFTKRSYGKYVVKRVDHLLRVVLIPSEKGLREIVLRDSRETALIGHYWNAVDLYLSVGDVSGFRKLKKKSVRDASGKRIALLTDLDELKRQGSAGSFSFETLYGRIG